MLRHGMRACLLAANGESVSSCGMIRLMKTDGWLPGMAPTMMGEPRGAALNVFALP